MWSQIFFFHCWYFSFYPTLTPHKVFSSCVTVASYCLCLYLWWNEHMQSMNRSVSVALSAFSNFSVNTEGCLLALVIMILANSVLMASTFLLLHLNNWINKFKEKKYYLLIYLEEMLWIVFFCVICVTCS